MLPGRGPDIEEMLSKHLLHASFVARMNNQRSGPFFLSVANEVACLALLSVTLSPDVTELIFFKLRGPSSALSPEKPRRGFPKQMWFV